jgi:uncharacterized membrane protein
MKLSHLRLTHLNLQLVAWLLLAAITLFYAVEMGHQSVLRYDTFKATAFDLGNMDQSVWNTLHGRPFHVTNQGTDWYGPPTRLAMHFEPIIFLVSLLYFFYADARTLLIFQTLALASGALPVFLLTRYYLPTLPLLAPVMAAAYLLSPALIGLNIFDFHFVSLATPLLLYAILALTYRRYGWLILACILAAACKEDIPFAIAMLGLLAVWKYKLPRLGTALFVGGMLWGLLAFMVIIPHFYPGGNNYLYRYAALGSSPQEIILNLLLHPQLIFTNFITLERFYYLTSLFRSTGFFSLLAPGWLLGALPGLAINLLSTDDKIYSGVFHYNAAIIPFVMLSAIHGLRRAIILWQRWHSVTEELIAVDMPIPLKSSTQTILMRPITRIQSRLTSLSTHRWQSFSERMAALARHIPLSYLQWVISTWIIAMITLNYLIMTPLFNIFWATHLPGNREQHIQQLLDMIPPDAPVSASGNINPHLTKRRYVTMFPQLSVSTTERNSNIQVQYVIVDLKNIFPEDKVGTAEVLNYLINSEQFRILARAEGVILLIRQHP